MRLSLLLSDNRGRLMSCELRSY